MHLYEATTILTKDGIQFKSYANDHPKTGIIAKPKYIPTDNISSNSMQFRFINGMSLNRLNMWIDKKELVSYVDNFKESYKQYIYTCPKRKNWFFYVPHESIAKIIDARIGLRQLFKLPYESLDRYLKLVVQLVNLVEESGVSREKIGITNSTLLGNYFHGISDIDLVIYGKDNTWKVLNHLKESKHPMLRWKTLEEWKRYFSYFNGFVNFTEAEFIKQASRKYSDGFFGETQFSIFGVEMENEIALPWDEGDVTSLGIATVKGKVTNNYNSIVRPGFYEISDSIVLKGPDVKVEKIVTYARDYMNQAKVGEEITACGVLEKVESIYRGPYYRVVIGYFDSYLTDRREKEFIKSNYC